MQQDTAEEEEDTMLVLLLQTETISYEQISANGWEE